jgi:chromosome segregation ATPase
MTLSNEFWPGDIRDGKYFDGFRWHQVEPRHVVEGDIGDWAECQAWKFAYGETWNFGDWANNTRTVQLMRRCTEAEKELAERREQVSIQQQLLDTLDISLRKWKEHASVMRGAGLVQMEEVERLQRELDAAKAEIERRCVNIDTLESELRQEKSITQLYINSRNRVLAKMKDQAATLAVNDAFIKVLGQRLRRRTAELRNVMMASRMCVDGLDRESVLDP